MSDKPLFALSIHEARQQLDDGNISAAQLTESVLERIGEVEPAVNAYITLCPDSARRQAEAADRAIAEKKAGPLTGIPLAVKDLICTREHPTTCAARMLADFIPPYDATVMES